MAAGAADGLVDAVEMAFVLVPAVGLEVGVQIEGRLLGDGLVGLLQLAYPLRGAAESLGQLFQG